jgi:hypothetical protein
MSFAIDNAEQLVADLRRAHDGAEKRLSELYDEINELKKYAPLLQEAVLEYARELHEAQEFLERLRNPLRELSIDPLSEPLPVQPEPSSDPKYAPGSIRIDPKSRLTYKIVYGPTPVLPRHIAIDPVDPIDDHHYDLTVHTEEWDRWEEVNDAGPVQES